MWGLLRKLYQNIWTKMTDDARKCQRKWHCWIQWAKPATIFSKTCRGKNHFQNYFSEILLTKWLEIIFWIEAAAIDGAATVIVNMP